MFDFLFGVGIGFCLVILGALTYFSVEDYLPWNLLERIRDVEMKVSHIEEGLKRNGKKKP